MSSDVTVTRLDEETEPCVIGSCDKPASVKVVERVPVNSSITACWCDAHNPFATGPPG